MKALAATDGSTGSFAALEIAGTVLDPADDELAIYFAPPAIKLSGGALDPAVLDRARQGLVDAVLETAETHLPAPWRGRTTRLVGHGSPRGDLVQAATGFAAQLVAVGARGLGPLKTLLLGSVSRHVVHATKTSVLVARPRADGAAGSWRVLVACEGTSGDEQLTRLLSRLHWPAGTRGQAISVVQPMFAGQVPLWLAPHARSPEVEAMAAAWNQEHQADLADRASAQASFCGALPALFAGSSPLVVQGHPAEQILAAMEREHADLVVLGAHREGDPARLLLGSTAEAVLAHARCSVLVVREPASP